MTNSRPTPPLWRVMQEAFESSPIFGDMGETQAYAAELEAIAAAMVDKFPAKPSADFCRVHAWLMDEAVRARRGE